MNNMKIIEQFTTLQGEGKYLGKPSLFLRTTGCNLRCTWANPDGTRTKCDTPYSSFAPERGTDIDTVETLIDLNKSNIEHIVITGGEPTIQPGLEDIVRMFVENKYKVTIETNTTNYVPMPGAFISMSPKLMNTYCQEDDQHARMHRANNVWRPHALRYMEHNDYQFKFVVEHPSDFGEIEELEKELEIPKDKIIIMPQGITEEQFKNKAKWIFSECVKRGYTYTPRLHIDLFGNVRGI